MSGFISRAACRGRRPSPFSADAIRERPSLSSKLLKNREVARCVVAPDGYGKTFLALEYAETMFDWVHVFWVNAKSPCFIRDLDAHDIAKACLGYDSEAALVVFDDVPALETSRLEQFSREIDELLAQGCEVIITCVPACDNIGSYQKDRIRISAVELLLDDREYDESITADERVRKPSDSVGPAYRVPALVWAKRGDAPEQFAKLAFSEEVPADLLLAMASAFVLGSGSLSSLRDRGLLGRGSIVDMLDDYPHLSFDVELDSFETPTLTVSALAPALRRRFEPMLEKSPFDLQEKLAYCWADMLLDVGDPARACNVIRELCPRKERAVWVIGNINELVRQACFFPLYQIACDSDCQRGTMRMRLVLIEAFCRRVLGDEEGSFRCAKRYAFDGTAPIAVRVCSLLIIARVGTGTIVGKANEGLRREVSDSKGNEALLTSTWLQLARAWCASAMGNDALADYWTRLRDEGACDEVLSVVSSWLFGMLDGETGVLPAQAAIAYRACERYVRDRLAAIPDGRVDYFAASAGLSMEEAHTRGVRYDAGVLEARLLIRLRQVEINILAQRHDFDAQARSERTQRVDWATTHPSLLMNQSEEPLVASKKVNVPTLQVRLFGCFEVTIGDELVESKRLNRHNARALLVLLAVNRGRELSRDAVAQTMWPRSSEAVAQKNFYTVWSQLRGALSLPDGTCPYLIRHQFGCSLSPRYVKSDVDRLEDICRELLFGLPNPDTWPDLYKEIDRDFASDLMPAETRNALVVRARNEYRTRLVDALVAATVSTLATEHTQWGIWFSRAAISHDDTREDAYVALMRAQIASNQRTAAMMTYLQCRRALSEKLGIDPAPETTALYESLLDSE